MATTFTAHAVIRSLCISNDVTLTTAYAYQVSVETTKMCSYGQRVSLTFAEHQPH